MCVPVPTEFSSFLKLFFHFLVALPTVILDVCIIKAIHFQRPSLKNSFYSLFAIYGGTQIILFVMNMYHQSLNYLTFLQCPIYQQFGDDKTFTYTLTFFYFFPLYVAFINGFCFMFLTINRLTAVVFPRFHKKSWKSCFPFVVGICFIFPFFFSVQSISPTGFALTPTGLVQTYHSWLPWFRISLAASIVEILVFSVATSSTILTIILLIRLPNRVKSLERNLCLVGLILTISGGVNTILQIYIYFIPRALYDTNILDYLDEIKSFVTDARFAPGAWSLYFMSTEIKHRIRQQWGIKTSLMPVEQITRTSIAP